MARPKTTEGGEPVSIRLSTRLMDEAKFAAEIMDKSVHEALREAIRIGFADLKRINYDIAGAVLDAVDKQKQESKQSAPKPHPLGTTPQTASPAGLPSNITPLPKQQLAAEQEQQDGEELPKKKVSYGSGRGKK